ncbi:hypothetical protein BDZ97DRAFT_1201503 [Flammula alnicola]|nr:hypothetical protein BDZ97DRAFT_1201503 [Flammula alnicola]
MPTSNKVFVSWNEWSKQAVQTSKRLRSLIHRACKRMPARTHRAQSIIKKNLTALFFEPRATRKMINICERVSRERSRPVLAYLGLA